MSVGVQARVANGVVERADGLCFGGRYYFPASDDDSEAVELAVWAEGTDAVHVELHVGDSFESSGQTWRLDEIARQGPAWSATLTRTA
jgi:Family of unknown function (DUF6406)